MENECLADLEEHDRKYNAGYVETLKSYKAVDTSRNHRILPPVFFV